ncbi:hypothetical protein RND71_028344 [Anisodus tanguticus]|uniref:Uncharacterized protein n=1 Tax=Anisodus tanguticus TaxID=243964 RepID=A0AAE1V713_9SOLA|nr:hypothetical protein RND71_028344 [Anisodus tanguticus]
MAISGLHIALGGNRSLFLSKGWVLLGIIVLVLGDACVFEFIKDLMLKFAFLLADTRKSCTCKEWEKSVGREMNDRRKRRQPRADKMFVPENPYFLQILEKYNIEENADVFRDNGLLVGDACVFELIRDLQADELILEEENVYVSKQMMGEVFVRDNCFVVGDACVFEADELMLKKLIGFRLRVNSSILLKFETEKNMEKGFFKFFSPENSFKEAVDMKRPCDSSSFDDSDEDDEDYVVEEEEEDDEEYDAIRKEEEDDEEVEECDEETEEEEEEYEREIIFKRIVPRSKRRFTEEEEDDEEEECDGETEA